MCAVRMGMVGCGGMAGAHRKALAELWGAGLKDIEVGAACDPDRERASVLAAAVEEHQGSAPPVFESVEAMLDGAKDLDAVDICTAHRLHHTIAKACFEAGKHVTIEKPLALTMRAARLILDAAESSGKILQVAENYRRSPAHRAINWAIRRGEIGKIRVAFWLDVRERDWYWGWREHRSEAGGGWVLDGGVHFVDLLRYHVGDVSHVQGLSRAFSSVRYRKRETREDPVEVDVEDTVLANLVFRDGAVGQWNSVTAAPGVGFSRRVLYGEEGSIDFSDGITLRGGETEPVDDLVKRFRGAIGGEEDEALFPAGITNTVATELHEFALAVQGRGRIEVTGLEGFRDEAVCFALYESSARGGSSIAVADIEADRITDYQRDLNEALGL